jgi:hypothetical protein
MLPGTEVDRASSEDDEDELSVAGADIQDAFHLCPCCEASAFKAVSCRSSLSKDVFLCGKPAEELRRETARRHGRRDEIVERPDAVPRLIRIGVAPTEAPPSG